MPQEPVGTDREDPATRASRHKLLQRHYRRLDQLASKRKKELSVMQHHLENEEVYRDRLAATMREAQQLEDRLDRISNYNDDMTRTARRFELSTIEMQDRELNVDSVKDEDPIRNIPALTADCHFVLPDPRRFPSTVKEFWSLKYTENLEDLEYLFDFYGIKTYRFWVDPDDLNPEEIMRDGEPPVMSLHRAITLYRGKALELLAFHLGLDYTAIAKNMRVHDQEHKKRRETERKGSERRAVNRMEREQRKRLATRMNGENSEAVAQRPQNRPGVVSAGQTVGDFFGYRPLLPPLPKRKQDDKDILPKREEDDTDILPKMEEDDKDILPKMEEDDTDILPKREEDDMDFLLNTMMEKHGKDMPPWLEEIDTDALMNIMKEAELARG